MSNNKLCPKCYKAGHDKTSDHLWLMADGITWHCNKPYHPPYYERDGKDLSVSGDINMNRQIDPSTLYSLSIRGIPDDVIKRYGIKVECNTTTRDHKRYYFPITKDKKQVTWKFKDLTIPKGNQGHFGRVDSGIKNVDFFGMNSYHLTPEYVILTEGELDAPSADYMLRNKFPKILCLSLTDGAGGHNEVARLKGVLDKARHLVICPDQDSAGQKFVQKACSIIPTAKVMSFSEKDANDMLTKGKQVEFIDAFINAQPYKPLCIVTSSDVKQEAMAPVKWGLDYPYPSLTKLTYGLRSKRIIGIGGAPGCGKTALVRAIQKHLMFDHKEKIGNFGLEESPAEQQREMAGFIMNKPLHLPTCQYKPEELRKVIDSFDEKVFFYDRKWYEKWEDVYDNMVYMTSMGVRYFFIDPISALVASLSPSDGNQYLNKAFYQLSLFVEKHNATVFYTSHLNNAQTGKDHAAGGKVYAGQFTGSKAGWRFSTDLWSAERDQYHEDETVRNTLKIVMLKYRKPSQPGSVYLEYSQATGTLSEQISKGGF